MLGFVYCQRRRIFLTVAAIIAETIRQGQARGDLLPFNNFSNPVFDISVTVVAFFLTALILMLIHALTLIVIPFLRFMIDGMLYFFASSFLIGNVNHALLGSPDPDWRIVFLVTILVLLIVSTSWTSRLSFRGSLSGSYSFTSKRDAETLWPFICPKPATLDQFWDGQLLEISTVDNRPNQRVAKYAIGGAAMELQDHEIITEKPNQAYAYQFQSHVPPNARVKPHGSVAVTLSHLNDKGCIRLTLDFYEGGMPLNTLFLSWLDDRPRDLLHSMRARDAGKRDFSIRGRAMREHLKAT